MNCWQIVHVSDTQCQWTKKMAKTQKTGTSIIKIRTDLDSVGAIELVERIQKEFNGGAAFVILDCYEMTKITLLGIAELTFRTFSAGFANKIACTTSNPNVERLFRRYKWKMKQINETGDAFEADAGEGPWEQQRLTSRTSGPY